MRRAGGLRCGVPKGGVRGKGNRLGGGGGMGMTGGAAVCAERLREEAQGAWEAAVIGACGAFRYALGPPSRIRRG
jgi:hypothetical protein